MPLAQLMSQIQELPKIDKLRLMQFLATELVKEEDTNFFVANREYPVWSPYNCSEAANVLMNLLATKQQEKNTCPHCKKFHRIKPHHVSKDKCMLNQMYKGYRFKSICDELEVAFKPCHKFAADLGGYAERDSNGSGSD